MLLLVAAGLVGLEYRLAGPWKTTRTLGYVLFFLCCVPTVAGFVAGWTALKGLCAVLLVASVPLVVFSRRNDTLLKSTGDFLAAGDVFESNDVQFRVTAPERALVARGEVAPLVIVAMNCVDVPRELRVRFGGDVEAVSCEREYVVPLAPGSVWRVLVPLRLKVGATGPARLLIGITGHGTEGGVRVRHATGAEWVMPSDAMLANVLGAASLLAFGSGSFLLGSNGAVLLQPDLERPFVDARDELVVTALAAPTADALLEARRR